MELTKWMKKLGTEISAEECRDHFLAVLFLGYCVSTHESLHGLDVISLCALDNPQNDRFIGLVKYCALYVLNVGTIESRHVFLEAYEDLVTCSSDELLEMYRSLYDEVVVTSQDLHMLTEPRLCEVVTSSLHLEGDEYVSGVNMGQGRFFVALHRKYPHLTLTGYDMNTDDLLVAQMTFYLEGVPVKILRGDFLHDDLEEKFDLVFANYPWNVELRNQVRQPKDAILDYTASSGKADFAYISKAINSTKETGQAIVVANDELIWKSHEEMKQKIIDLHLIESIVEMPAGTWAWTPLSYNLLTFSYHNKGTKMIDASDCVLEKKGQKYLDVDSIVERIENASKLDLNFPLSDLHDLHEQEHIKPKNFTRERLPISDLCDVFVGTTKNGEEVPLNLADYLLVNVSDLKDGHIDLSSVKGFRDQADLSTYQIQKGDILVTIKGSMKNIAYVKDAPNVRLIPSSNIAVVRVHSKVLLASYLYLFLTSEIGQHLLDHLKKTKTSMNLNRNEILDLEVPILDLTNQKDLIKKYHHLKKKRERLLKQLDEVNKEIAQILI